MLRSIVPRPVLASAPLEIGTPTDKSTAAEPLPTFQVRLPPPRSIKPELPEPAPLAMVAVAPARELMLTSPFTRSLAGVVLLGMRLIVLNVSVPPLSVNVQIG